MGITGISRKQFFKLVSFGAATFAFLLVGFGGKRKGRVDELRSIPPTTDWTVQFRYYNRHIRPWLVEAQKRRGL